MMDIPVSDDHNKLVTRKVNSQGIEVTPEEVCKVRRTTYIKLRRIYRALGYNPPDGDLEFLIWLNKRLHNKGA